MMSHLLFVVPSEIFCYHYELSFSRTRTIFFNQQEHQSEKSSQIAPPTQIFSQNFACSTEIVINFQHPIVFALLADLFLRLSSSPPLELLEIVAYLALLARIASMSQF